LKNKDLELLEKNEKETTRLSVALSLYIAGVVFISLFSIYKIFFYLTSNEVSLVSCPKSTQLDTPVTLTPISFEDPGEQEMWIRGFVRKYVTSLFPRTGEDVKPFLDYVINHSEGTIKRKYESFKANIQDYTSLVDSGYLIKFYPKSTVGTRIRLKEPGVWIVEIDGYMIKQMRLADERSTPTLRFTVETTQKNSLNPEGLVVTETNVEQIIDYVSGRKNVK